MGIRMIVTDLDGTLLLDDHRSISPRTAQMLRLAAGKGCRIAIASGRTLAGIQSILDELGCVRYALISNGAAVIDLKSGQNLFCQGMPWQIWHQVYDVLESFGEVFEIYFQGKSYMNVSLTERYKKRTMTREFLEEMLGRIQLVPDVKKAIGKAAVEKCCLARTDPKTADKIRSGLSEIPGLCITSSVPGNLEINETGTNKGNALCKLCEQIQIRPEEVMAFGDEENDLEMLRYAGWSFAMGNACDSAKAAARYRTKRNTEDGIAEAMEEYRNLFAF